LALADLRILPSYCFAKPTAQDLKHIFSNCIIKLKIEEIIDRQAEREKEKRSGITSNKG